MENSIIMLQTISDSFKAQVVGSTILHSFEELVNSCSIPITYSTNQTLGKDSCL